MKSYSIVRMFQDDNISSKTIKTGLTLEEAKEHCNHSETSSSTCKEPVNVQRTQLCGEWFDGFNEEQK